MNKVYCRLVMLALLSSFVGNLSAQTKLSGPAQIEARAAELHAIQDQLGDPDPIKRQAAIQVIVESGDADKVDFALKIALASDDAPVRATALRAYMAHLKTLGFEVQAPPDVQKQIEGALASDPNRIKDLEDRNPYVKVLVDAGYHMQFTLKGYTMSSGTGEATVAEASYSTNSSFTVSGDRVSGTALVFNGYTTCNYIFQPQILIKGTPPILKGTLRCAWLGGAVIYPILTITAPMF